MCGEEMMCVCSGEMICTVIGRVCACNEEIVCAVVGSYIGTLCVS